jgi:hypothetical protein
MLSLSEVPYCESAVMKTRLNCHESAQMSAAAAIGSIGSIFDVSMARGGSAAEADSGRAVEGVPRESHLRSSLRWPWGGAPSNFCAGTSGVTPLGHPVQTYTNPGPHPGTIYQKMRHLIGAGPLAATGRVCGVCLVPVQLDVRMVDDACC